VSRGPDCSHTGNYYHYENINGKLTNKRSEQGLFYFGVCAVNAVQKALTYVKHCGVLLNCNLLKKRYFLMEVQQSIPGSTNIIKVKETSVDPEPCLRQVSGFNFIYNEQTRLFGHNIKKSEIVDWNNQYFKSDIGNKYYLAKRNCQTYVYHFCKHHGVDAATCDSLNIIQS